MGDTSVRTTTAQDLYLKIRRKELTEGSKKELKKRILALDNVIENVCRPELEQLRITLERIQKAIKEELFAPVR